MGITNDVRRLARQSPGPTTDAAQSLLRERRISRRNVESGHHTLDHERASLTAEVLSGLTDKDGHPREYGLVATALGIPGTNLATAWANTLHTP